MVATTLLAAFHWLINTPQYRLCSCSGMLYYSLNSALTPIIDLGTIHTVKWKFMAPNWYQFWLCCVLSGGCWLLWSYPWPNCSGACIRATGMVEQVLVPFRHWYTCWPTFLRVVFGHLDMCPLQPIAWLLCIKAGHSMLCSQGIATRYLINNGSQHFVPFAEMHIIW
jgi:hypothetical protein